VFCFRLVDLIGIMGAGGARRTFSSGAIWLRVLNGGKEEKVLSRDVVWFGLVAFDGESAEKALSSGTLEMEGADSHGGIGESAISLDVLCFILLDLNGSGTDNLFSSGGICVAVLTGESEDEALSLSTLSLKVACLAGAEDGKEFSRDLPCFRLVDLTRGGKERALSLGRLRLSDSGLEGLEGRNGENDVLCRRLVGVGGESEEIRLCLAVPWVRVAGLGGASEERALSLATK
jgi:hypothetical protein